LIHRKLRILGIVGEYDIIEQGIMELIKASRSDADMGAEEIRLVEFVIVKEELKLFSRFMYISIIDMNRCHPRGARTDC
jgi:hypothetical protein